MNDTIKKPEIMYFSAESIILNLLCYYHGVSNGIDLSTIQKYCSALKRELYINRKYRGLVYFECAEPYISEYVYRNRYIISTVLNKYYRNCSFNGEYLIDQICLDSETISLMKTVAEQLDSI